MIDEQMRDYFKKGISFLIKEKLYKRLKNSLTFFILIVENDFHKDDNLRNILTLAI